MHPTQEITGLSREKILHEPTDLTPRLLLDVWHKWILISFKFLEIACLHAAMFGSSCSRPGILSHSTTTYSGYYRRRAR